jgi:lambda repressor-like predicted transcriptional regulator
MATANPIDREIQKLEMLQAAKFLRAYLEAGDEIQSSIRDLLAIVADPNTDDDDREMTLFTLADALFPNPHEGKLGMDLEESEQLGASASEETREVLAEMDREEEAFAQRLQAVMAKQGITQETLAAKLGIGQPAISNMLNRRCRPQRRTILSLSQSLGVAPEELWPGLKTP